MNEVKLSAAQWRKICRRVFTAWGAPDDIAQCVANSLVESNLAGLDSHGVVRIVNYYNFVKPGWWRPANRPEVAREGPCSAVIDGNWGFGQPAVHLALDLGIAKAREHGISGIGIIRAGHVGRLGEYAERAAGEGMVALLTVNNGRSGGHVAPYGGVERVFSTNPLAAAVPARRHPPFIMDFATTVVAAGKVELAPDLDMPIPPGWAIDSEGRPATTARQYMEGGAMLPFAGHKGYALALLVELLSGALTGAGVTQRPSQVPSGGLGFAGNAAFLIVVDIAHFTDPDQFFGDVDGLFDRLHAVRPAPGFERVLIPGEPEAEQRARHAATSEITIHGTIWERIAQVAAESQVSLDEFIPQDRELDS